jgi:DNA adenine methylase
LFGIDPPYFRRGSELYKNFYAPEDHALVAETVQAMDRYWLVTYDDVPEIRSLYGKSRQFEIQQKYSVQTKRIGTELLIVSHKLSLPQLKFAAAQ